MEAACLLVWEGKALSSRWKNLFFRLILFVLNSVQLLLYCYNIDLFVLCLERCRGKFEVLCTCACQN